MGKLIEQQAVIDCLTNTAKYYDMPQADEWTKGIHYGLLHGIDNILDNVKPVEAIPKADYENRLKADMVAMLSELEYDLYHELCKEIHGKEDCPCTNQTTSCLATFRVCDANRAIGRTIQHKINELKDDTRPYYANEWT